MMDFSSRFPEVRYDEAWMYTDNLASGLIFFEWKFGRFPVQHPSSKVELNFHENVFWIRACSSTQTCEETGTRFGKSVEKVQISSSTENFVVSIMRLFIGARPDYCNGADAWTGSFATYILFSIVFWNLPLRWLRSLFWTLVACRFWNNYRHLFQ